MRDEERDARSSRGLSSSAKITASGVGTRPLLTLCTILSAHGEHDWNFLGVALLNSTWSGRVEWVERKRSGWDVNIFVESVWWIDFDNKA